MLETSRNAVFFQWFVCQVSRKVGLLQRRVRSHVVSGEIKNCTPLWRKAHLQVKVRKTPQSRTYFGISDVQKWHAAVARSTFASQNVQNMTCLDHFGTFWCWKIVRGCGEKHICKSKCTKPVSSEALFCSSAVEKTHAAVAKSICGNENVQNMRCLEHFCKFRCRKMARRCGETHMCKWKCTKHELCCGETHMCKWKCTKHEVFGALLYVRMSKNGTRLCLFWPQVLTPSRSRSRSWWINVCKNLFWLAIYCLLSLNYHLDLHRVSTHMVCLTKEKKELKLKGAAVATVVGIVVKLLLVLFTNQLIN